jgi:pimeloyl-ACP methyl ester carboxylesterase
VTVRPLRTGGLAAAVAAALSLTGTAPAAASDYCTPERSVYDPPDVPRGGSRVRTAPGVTRSAVTVDGVRIPVLTSGPPGSREAVVFMHGIPSSSQDWLDLLPRVGALGRRAVAFDMPGFGHAGKPWHTRNDIHEGARFLGHMLSRLGIARVHFVLHDVGGASALQWSSQHPDALISAVMMDTGLLGYRHHSLAQITRTPEVGELFWQTLNRATWTSGMRDGQDRRPLPPSFVDRLYDDLDRGTRCTVIKIYRQADEPQVNAWGRAQAKVLSARRRPALIIWGGRDPYLPVGMARRQREVFPGAALHVFGDSGHWPFADDPARTASVLLPFVRCLPTGKRDRIRLKVRPRRIRARRRVRVRFRVTVRRDGIVRPVCGATVRFRHRKATTDGFGGARLGFRRIKRGRYKARASKPGLVRGRATVFVGRRHRRR